MKSFVVKLLLFVVLFFAADFTLGKVIRFFHAKTENTMLLNTNYGFVDYKSDDVLFFGASEVSHSFISNRVKEKTGLSSYNLASDGCGIYYQYPLLETIIKRHSPKVILLSSSQLNDYSPSYLTRLYPYYNKNPYAKKVIDELFPKEFIKLAFQGYVFNSQIIRIFDSKDANVKGYIALPPEDTRIESGQYSELPPGVNHSISKETITYFNKFVQLATSKGATVYVCIPPELNKINSNYLERVVSITENSGARLIDFSKDPSFLDHPEFFHDATHINHDGAKVMTDKFIEILKEDGVY